MRKIIAVSVFAMVAAASVQAFALTALPQTLIGNIVSISENALVVIYENEDIKQELEIQVNNETRFEEADSLDALQKEDLLEVKYIEEDGRAFAVTIKKINTIESAQ